MPVKYRFRGGRSMITIEEARAIAQKVCKGADTFVEYPNGFLFMRKEDRLSISDPGVAIDKKTGRIYVGFAAREFLLG